MKLTRNGAQLMYSYVMKRFLCKSKFLILPVSLSRFRSVLLSSFGCLIRNLVNTGTGKAYGHSRRNGDFDDLPLRQIQ